MRKTTLLTVCTAILLVTAALGADADKINQKNHIRRVLLVSIDGVHAVDYINCSQTLPASARSSGDRR